MYSESFLWCRAQRLYKSVMFQGVHFAALLIAVEKRSGCIIAVFDGDGARPEIECVFNLLSPVTVPELKCRAIRRVES